MHAELVWLGDAKTVTWTRAGSVKSLKTLQGYKVKALKKAANSHMVLSRLVKNPITKKRIDCQGAAVSKPPSNRFGFETAIESGAL